MWKWKPWFSVQKWTPKENPDWSMVSGPDLVLIQTWGFGQDYAQNKLKDLRDLANGSFDGSENSPRSVNPGDVEYTFCDDIFYTSLHSHDGHGVPFLSKCSDSSFHIFSILFANSLRLNVEANQRHLAWSYVLWIDAIFWLDHKLRISGLLCPRLLGKPWFPRVFEASLPVGNWGDAGEDPCYPPGYSRVSRLGSSVQGIGKSDLCESNIHKMLFQDEKLNGSVGWHPIPMANIVLSFVPCVGCVVFDRARKRSVVPDSHFIVKLPHQSQRHVPGLMLI